jgi:hypothetical protein
MGFADIRGIIPPQKHLVVQTQSLFHSPVRDIRSLYYLGGIYLHSAGMQHICSVHKAKYGCIKVTSSGI